MNSSHETLEKFANRFKMIKKFRNSTITRNYKWSKLIRKLMNIWIRILNLKMKISLKIVKAIIYAVNKK